MQISICSPAIHLGPMVSPEDSIDLSGLVGAAATTVTIASRSVRGGMDGFSGDAQTLDGASGAEALPKEEPLRCAGLAYAHMKKEQARETFKLRRRNELISAGEENRVKRRKKNDKSMSDPQKYVRRLKMNQDSAAAARVAHDAYISTLENLVHAGEREKKLMSVEGTNLRDERDSLVAKLGALQRKVAGTVATGPKAGDEAQSLTATDGEICARQPEIDSASTQALLRKMTEHFASKVETEVTADICAFTDAIMGTLPAPAS